jgi:hypothetical protein
MSKTHSSFFQNPFVRIFLLLTIATILIGLSSITFSSRPKVSAQSTPSPPCLTCSPPTQQAIYVPTIGLPEATGNEIVLNCRSPQVMEATPTFYTSEGEAIVGDVIRLQPAEIRFVSVESLIPAEHRGRHVWGGMSLSYTGGLLQVWAQITLHGLNGIGSADVTFSVLNGRGSDTQEAVWWMPNGNSTAIIALGNSSNVPIHTRLQYSGGETQEIDIAPFATRYIRRQRGNSVKLTTTGPAGSLKVAGFVTNSNQKFTSGIRFYETQNAVQSNLFATNFKVKNQSSHLLLKNTTTASVTARPRFRLMSETGNAVELPQITLAPGEITELDLRPLVAAAETRNDLDSVSVMIENSGSPGSLIGALYSSDRTTDVTQDVPLRDSGVVRNSTGAYPWRLDDDYTSVVSITNVGNETAQFGATIRYNGGQYTLQPRALNVGQTAVFDIKKIRDEQRPDAFGSVMPRTATNGQFSWSLIRSSGTARLVGRSEVTSKSRKDNRSYSCPRCCPSSGPLFDVPPIVVNAAAFAHFTVLEGWSSCDGVTDWYLGGIPGLYSYDTSIATATMFQQGTMQVDGIDAGDTTWSSELFHYWYWYSDGLSECYLNDFDMTSNGEMAIKPTITSISPSRGVVGSTTRVTINGSGFRSGATVSAGAGITVTVVSVTSTRIIADFAISINAGSGNRDVTVTVRGIASTPKTFFVQTPVALKAISVTQTDLGCALGSRGYGVKIIYQVLDEKLDPILKAGMTPEEFITTSIGSGSTEYEPFATPRTTDSMGQFTDIPVGTCSDARFNFCINVRQQFRIKIPVSGQTEPEIFLIGTETRRLDCRDGIRVEVATGTSSQVFTLGTVPQ